MHEIKKIEIKNVNEAMEKVELLALYHCATALDNFLTVSVRLHILIPDSSPSSYPIKCIYLLIEIMFLNV